MFTDYPYMTLVERMRAEHGLTQRALAQHANLGILYIIRAEQCVPLTLGEDLAKALAMLPNQYYVSPSDLEQQYVADRLAMLAFYKEQLQSHPEHEHYIERALGYALDNYAPGVGSRLGSRLSHPLYLFRTELMRLHEWPDSAIKFNQFFGLHGSVISAIENRKDTIERDSSAFVVLRDTIGMDEVRLEMLMKACDSCL